MKKIILAVTIAAASMLAPCANAQSILSNLLKGAASAAANSSDAQDAGKNVLGNLANEAVNAANNSSIGQASGGLLGNLIASVTGSATTTKGNLIGTWSYSEPAVQFESENLLTQAGGGAIAQKIETKLGSYYKLVGIKPGKLAFKFENNGKMTYSAGSISREGSYVFNDESKTLTITTSAGSKMTGYVTISGNQMELCFDGSKLLTLMETLGSRFQTLNAVTSLAKQYSGMKVGFAFEKQ